MKLISVVAAGIVALAPFANAAVPGFDISHYQASVNYQGAYNSGARFVMIKVRLPPPTEPQTHTAGH